MQPIDEMERNLVAWLADMREDEAIALASRMLLELNIAPLRVLDLCRLGMDEVGRRFEVGEYFLPELVLAGEMLDKIGAIAKPLLNNAPGGQRPHLGRVLIGTVHGDLHDIGKNIVTFMLEINGFEVRDIGVDVPVAVFLEEIRNFQPNVIGLSGFLTLAFDAIRDTVAAIEHAGLREGRKIMIGGGQIDETVRRYTGADALGANAVEAVALCKSWCGDAA